jgi:hypothetical protein
LREVRVYEHLYLEVGEEKEPVVERKVGHLLA